MTWNVSFSREAVSFLGKARRISYEDITELIGDAVKKFGGERININIKKLKGEWTGFHRIRKGDLRIVVEFNFDNHSAFVERIDWRGRIYK